MIKNKYYRSSFSNLETITVIVNIVINDCHCGNYGSGDDGDGCDTCICLQSCPRAGNVIRR